jgi:hypothetical protein
VAQQSPTLCGEKMKLLLLNISLHIVTTSLETDGAAFQITFSETAAKKTPKIYVVL